MKTKCFLGVDIGTSSVKALVVTEKGQIVSSAQRGYDILKPDVKYAEQNPEQLWLSAKETIGCVVSEVGAERIRGIGFSGQMHGLVMVDDKMRVLDNAIIWADQRSAEEIEQIYELAGKDALCDRTGNQLSTGFLLASLQWIKKHKKELYNQVYKVMPIKDYIRLKMTGEIVTDVSDASGTGAFDLEKRCWSREIIEATGHDMELFPPVAESCQIVGEVSADCAKDTGLREGTKVVAGGGDTLVQAVGNGMIEAGVLGSNIGTASQILSVAERPLRDAKYRTNTFCHSVPERWMLMGAHLSGGVALKWLKNQVLEMKDFNQMTRLAQDVQAGSEGLLFLPYLSGERTPVNDPGAQGIYLGFTLKHSRAHMIRSTMEGIVFAMKNSLELLREQQITYDKIIASGGAANSPLFMQIQADMYGQPVYKTMDSEQAGKGAAILAAVGVGEFGSIEEACREMVHFEKAYAEPIQENVEMYEERYKVYRQLYEKNKELF